MADEKSMDEYPSVNDFRVFVEEKFKRDRTQRFLKRNKQFFVHAFRTEDVADITKYILFGYTDAEALKEGLLSQEGDGEVSTALTFKSDTSLGELSTDLERLKGETLDESSELQIVDTQQGDGEVNATVSYKHRRETQRNLLNSEDKIAKFDIETTGEEDVWMVSQDYYKNDEFRALKKTLDSIDQKRQEDDRPSINMGDITLDPLTLENKVEFFNDLLTYNPGTWSFQTVLELGLQRGDDDNEIFEEEEKEDLQEQLDDRLVGINRAVLKGEGLRSNGFVQDCIDNNYFFNSALVRYENTDVAKVVELSVEFKQGGRQTFDICIEGEYELNGEGEREPDTFTPEFREGIRSQFRDAIINLYGRYVDMPGLIEEKHTPQSIGELHGVGPKLEEKLKDAGYDSVDDVRSASTDELREIKGIGEEMAESLVNN